MVALSAKRSGYNVSQASCLPSAVRQGRLEAGGTPRPIYRTPAYSRGMNPASIYGGLSAERFYNLPKFPAGAYTLRARIVGAETPVEITAAQCTGSGADWRVLIPAASLAALATGDYTLLIIATDSAGAEQLAAKETIKFYAAAETDLRSDLHKMLDALNATLAKKATRDQASMSYNGRSISRLSWDELLKARDAIARQVRAEENSLAGRSRIQTVKMRFIE